MIGTNILTDKDGKQTQLYEYTPFGSLTTNAVILRSPAKRDDEGSDSSASPVARPQNDGSAYLYTGKELDSPTNLYYYGTRYYNPLIAKFIQPDPIIQDVYDPQSLNHYAYCRNNPLKYTDPTGLSYDDWDSWRTSNTTFRSNSGFSSYHSWGSSYSGGRSSSWDTHSWSSTYNNYSSSWGYSQIGSTLSTWSSTSNSLNSFTTQSMTNFSSGLGSNSLSSLMSGWKNSSSYRQATDASGALRELGSYAGQAWNQFSSRNMEFMKTGLSALWNYGQIDIGYTGIGGKPGLVANVGAIFMPSRGFYYYYGSGPGIGTGISVTAKIGTLPSSGTTAVGTIRGGTGLWGVKGNMGINLGTKEFSGSVGLGWGIGIGYSIVVNRTVGIISWGSEEK